MRSTGGWAGGEAHVGGCTGRTAGITGTFSALISSHHVQARWVRSGSCRLCLGLDAQRSRGMSGETQQNLFLE